MADDAGLNARYPGAHWCDFGDSPALSKTLLDLIRSGRKTATCGALRDYQGEDDPVPVAGDIMIARDASGRAALVYEITECTIRRFRDVPEDFALAEAEGSFQDWQQGHIEFFTRNGGFDPGMELVCERFRLIEVLS